MGVLRRLPVLTRLHPVIYVALLCVYVCLWKTVFVTHLHNLSVKVCEDVVLVFLQ